MKKSWLIAAAALVLGVWLSLIELADRGTIRADPISRIPSEPLTGSKAPQSASSELPGPARDEPTTSPQRVSITVRVTNAESGAAIAGASVVWAESSADELVAKAGGFYPSVGPESGSVETKGDGTATFEAELETTGAALWLGAEAAGFVPASRLAAPGERSEYEIALQPGAEIRGRVVDPSGNGVPDVQVLATHTRCPKGTIGRVHRAALAHGWSRTASGPAGEYVLSGLEPGGHYRLRMAGDGWKMWDFRRPPPSDSRHDSSATAGQSGLSTVLVPFRIYRVQLVWADKKTPIGLPVRLAPHGPEAQSLWWGNGQQSDRFHWSTDQSFRTTIGMRIGLRTETPGLHTGFIEFPGADSVLEETQLLIQGAGLQVHSATVRLRTPSQLRDDPAPDLLVVPGHESGSGVDVGTVVATLRGPGASQYAEGLSATLESVGELTPIIVQGVRGREGTWQFDGVPGGGHSYRMWLGASVTEPTQIVVRPERVAKVTLELPSPTGITLDVRDESDSRVYDFVFKLKKRGGKRWWWYPSRASALLTRNGLPVLAPIHVSAGDYHFELSKQHVGRVTGTLTVVADEITALRPVLRGDG